VSSRHDSGRRRLPSLSMKRIPTLPAVLCLMFCMHPGFTQTSTSLTDSPEYLVDEVKAAFLYHFGTYVEWPADDADVITIAVLEADTISSLLQEFLVGRTINGRPVQTKVITSITDLASEQILYIGSAANSRLDELLMALDARPVLVVTDTAEGLRDGAMINFIQMNDRMVFEISRRSASRARLTLSSRLLAAAFRVEPDD
jgi:hypothetical protein